MSGRKRLLMSDDERRLLRHSRPDKEEDEHEHWIPRMQAMVAENNAHYERKEASFVYIAPRDYKVKNMRGSLRNRDRSKKAAEMSASANSDGPQSSGGNCVRHNKTREPPPSEKPISKLAGAILDMSNPNKYAVSRKLAPRKNEESAGRSWRLETSEVREKRLALEAADRHLEGYEKKLAHAAVGAFDHHIAEYLPPGPPGPPTPRFNSTSSRG